MERLLISLLLVLISPAPGRTDRLPVFDDRGAYAVRSFEQGRIWVEQLGVTFLCTLSPERAPAAMVLRNCQPLVTPSLHQDFSVAQVAAGKVQQVVAVARKGDEAGALAEAEGLHIAEDIAALEALADQILALSDAALADRVLSYSRDLAELSGQTCLLEPAEMAPANAINAGQLLFLEFGIVTRPGEAVTLPFGMELEVRAFLQELRRVASASADQEVTVQRIDLLHEALRLVRQRLRAANEQLLRDGRHAWQGRSVRITSCA